MTMASTGAAGHCVPAPLRRSPPPVGARRAMRRPASRARVRRWAVACASDGAAPQLLEAAEHTVDNYIKSGMMIGLGSGHASSMVMQYLGRRLREGALKDIIGIPTSISSASEAAKAGIPLSDYQDSLQSIIKTSGKLAFIITENQYTRDLDGSIPVIVKSGNWMETAEEIDDLFLGDAEVWRRPATGYAGPLGGDFPLITREGYHVLDVIFTSPIRDLAQVSDDLDQIDGVVDHGIVFRTPCTAIIASNVGLQIVDNLPMNAAGQM
uniref:ribose-5-phosphate isomerase n=1 Tax=Anthurium amnicola TaxID=1678845 RepID=A0A1D1Z5C4_9ARAE